MEAKSIMSLADKYFKKEINTLLSKGFNDKDYKVRPVWIDTVNDKIIKTPAHTIKTSGLVTKYNLQEEFPIQTLRMAPFKYAVKERLWRFQKKSNDVRELGSHIWDAWTLKDPITGEDTFKIGKTYGYIAGEKYDYPEGKMDQVDHILYCLKNNPRDRRMIIQLFKPEYIKQSGLPPCLASYYFSVEGNKLNMLVVRRSCDCLAAAGAGLADEIGMAVLQHRFAQATGLIANELMVVKANYHIYDQHIPIVKKILNNPEYPAPKFWINPEVKDFYAFKPEDFKLIDYKYTKLDEKIPVAE